MALNFQKITPSTCPSQPGIYLLVMYLGVSQTIQVGALGPNFFPEGHYMYIGSAQGGLHRRVSRYFKSGSKRRKKWHVDYLLEKAGLEEVWAWVYQGKGREPKKLGECQVAQKLSRFFTVPLPGFGASDCHCSTHLLYSSTGPDLNSFNLCQG